MGSFHGPVILSSGAVTPEPLLAEPQQVNFPSLDGTTQIVGYLFIPKAASSSPWPAVVMMQAVPVLTALSRSRVLLVNTADRS